MAESDFWTRNENREQVIQELKSLKNAYMPYKQCLDRFVDLKELLTVVDDADTSSHQELFQELAEIEKALERLEFSKLLGGEADHCGVLLSINAGAGGTESCDWAAMLTRMYMRWADSKGYTCKEVDSLPGEGAGLKNVTLSIEGSYAYGYLKSENGVHRLVRISPFDSNKRRHTSFASVEVIPEIDDDIQIDISPADLKVDTYRAGGKGGQHVNKTESAVRITHVPTGVVVQCQSERSQHKNKTTAMKMLRSKLYNLKLQEKKDKSQQSYEAKNEIAWGSQIRSYVLHPYNLVKDVRTDHETSNALGVLEGDLDGFIEAYLKWNADSKPN